MTGSRRFVAQNPELLVRDGLALYLAVSAHDEIATRQLLREYETSYPAGYGKQVAIKTLPLVNAKDKEWMRNLY